MNKWILFISNNCKYLTRHINRMSNEDKIELGKKTAAYRAIDENIDSSTKIVGIGSGSTILYGVERLGERVRNENLQILCIPTSFQSKQAILKNGLNLTDLESHSQIDVTIDGADEVDKDLNCIKGGGGCHLQEKLIAFYSNKFIVVADSRKKSQQFGENWSKGIPIEVIPSAYKVLQERIESKFGGEACLRQAKAKAGPVVTDNGNFIIDWKFDRNKLKVDTNNNTIDWISINTELSLMPGVIETGLFLDLAKKAYFGDENGEVCVLSK